MWIKFHELTSSLGFSEMWELFVSEQGCGTLSPLLYQHITDVIFERIIESKLTTAFSLSCSVENVGLTYEEENAIHYVGGYVIRQLNVVNRGGLTRITNEAFKGFCDIEIIIRRFLCIDERNE